MATGTNNKSTNKEGSILLKLDKVTKIFPGVVAIDKVELEVLEGEIHAIVGENGAGKSTLCNVITGFHHPEEGEIFWQGKKVDFKSPKQAIDAGIRMVYQERNLIPYLTGGQNIVLGDEPRKGLLVDEKKILEHTNALKKRFGAIVPLDVPVMRLTPSYNQLIEILRALNRTPKLLILDEPTSSLTQSDVKILFKVLRNIKKEYPRLSVIFISHKLHEVFDIADRISIFRNGKKIHTDKACNLDRIACIKYMINRDLSNRYPEVIPHFSKSEKVLEIENVSEKKGKVHDVNMFLRKGEVLGLYGLVGSGRTELSELVFGLRKKEKGKINYQGKEVNITSPYDAIHAGIFLIPEDRRRHGIFNGFNLKENLSIAFLKDKLTSTLGKIKRKEEINFAYIAADKSSLKIKYTNIEQDVSNLSGGNKQKVIIGRWLAGKNATVLIMDEPTNGIDIGTKYEIYELMRDLTKQGMSIIFISSELPEVLGVCDRICVFREGSISGILQREEFSEQKVLEYALI